MKKVLSFSRYLFFMVNNKDGTIKRELEFWEDYSKMYGSFAFFSVTFNFPYNKSWVRKISKENLTLESQQSQWQQGFHVSHTLYKSDVTFTSSSGVNNVRENETLFLVCVEVRVPNLNKLKWKNLNIVQDLPIVLLLMILLEFSESVHSFLSFLSLFRPSVLFSPPFLHSLFLPSLPSLSFIKHFSSVRQMPDTGIYRQEDPVPALMKLTIYCWKWTGNWRNDNTQW